MVAEFPLTASIVWQVPRSADRRSVPMRITAVVSTAHQADSGTPCRLKKLEVDLGQLGFEVRSKFENEKNFVEFLFPRTSNVVLLSATVATDGNSMNGP